MTDKSLEILWGAKEIGEEIGLSERQTFHMLERGHIRAARKIGGKWASERSKLHKDVLAGMFDAPTETF